MTLTSKVFLTLNTSGYAPNYDIWGAPASSSVRFGGVSFMSHSEGAGQPADPQPPGDLLQLISSAAFLLNPYH